DEAHLIYGKDKEASNKESADKESADQFWATVNLQKVSSINIIIFVAYGYRSSN
ncbi:18631_t:CDS:1, partial [Rhizophagus irregularis]